MSYIPKIIHQIWLQGETHISNESRKYINKIKNIHNITNITNINNITNTTNITNANNTTNINNITNTKLETRKKLESDTWEYMLWDEIQILNLLKKLDNKHIEKYYKFIYLHQKVDYAKFIILKEFGGIYIDIDCNIIKRLDELFEYVKNYDFIVSYISQKNKLFNYIGCGYAHKCINNGIIISKKDTDICNYIIDKLKYDCNSIINKKSRCIQNTTGPTIFNKIVYSYLSDSNRGKSKSNVLILPPEFVEPCLFDVCNNTKNTYIQHIHEWSWIGKHYKNICLFYTRNTIILNAISIIILCFLIYTLYNHKPSSYKSSL